MVEIIFLEDNPLVLACLGVKISQTPLKIPIETLYEECKKDMEGARKLIQKIIQKYRHRIVAEFLPYAIIFEKIPRFETLFIWRVVSSPNLMVGAGLEASFRVVEPDRYKEIVGDLGEMAFSAYETAVKLGVPAQDARYMLPEATLTRMIFTAPPRYLMKLANYLKETPLPELKEIGEKIENLIREKFNLEISEEKPPSKWEFWGEKRIREGIFLDYSGEIPSLSLNMGIKGSLAMLAQVARERQSLVEIEPLEQIAKRGSFVVPSSFPEEVIKDYQKIAKEAKRRQMELIEKKDPEFVYYLLMGQQAKAMIYGKGFGIIEISRERSCGAAQWEIRNAVGIPLTRELMGFKELEKEIGPRCWREQKCLEPATFKTKIQNCRPFKLSIGKWQGSLKELLDLLQEPQETFVV